MPGVSSHERVYFFLLWTCSIFNDDHRLGFDSSGIQEVWNLKKQILPNLQGTISVNFGKPLFPPENPETIGEKNKLAKSLTNKIKEEIERLKFIRQNTQLL